MTKIMLATNGSGFQIDKCLAFDFFREAISVIVSDRQCNALTVASKHGIKNINFEEENGNRLNDKMLEVATIHGVEYIISPGFTRVFRNQLLQAYSNRVFNCHPSILPAFRGFYDTRDTKQKYPARKIFERVIDFGSLVSGNTIHVVSEAIDEGCPLIVSTLAIPYGEDMRYTRHRLFIQECKCLLQIVFWLCQGRVSFNEMGRPLIQNASFSDLSFSPSLEEEEIVNFWLPPPL